MVTSPILQLHDFSKQFMIKTDASGISIDAVLMQADKLIAFISKALSICNQAKSVYYNELMVVLTLIHI